MPVSNVNINDDSVILKRDNQSMFAEIIIPLFLPQNYTWSIPEEWKEVVQPGIRVEVALRNKKYTGIVKRLFHNPPEGFEPKPILNIIDNEPLVYDEQLKLWQWIAQYYMCTEGEVMQAALPANFKLTSESILIWNSEFEEEDMQQLDDEEFIVAEALLIKKELKLSEVQQLLDSSHVYPVIKKLIDKKVCFIWEELKQKYKAKKESYVLLHMAYNNEQQLEKLLNDWSGAPKQMELLLAYLHLKQTEGEVIKSALLQKSGATSAQLNALIKKKILLVEKRAIDRLPNLQPQVSIDFDLSEAQQMAYATILQNFEDKNVNLLHGVTSSGKTQIYIKLLEEAVNNGQQALYMLPEIALTSQIIRRLQKHFGGNIAVYHSKFNANERVELWNKIKTGETKILLGARSALFLPFKSLGLIIIDEEHDTSYKQQEPAPRYHARDAAIYYAGLCNARVLLGSATPSLETYFNCKNNKYGLIELTERYGNVAMPEIKLVDIRKIPDPAEGEEKDIFSAELKEAVSDTLQQNKQVILFQNRRGYTPYFICNTCGWIPHCKDCDVTLTYHKGKNKLSCHYCGKEYPVIQTCIACGSHDFRQKKFGTEKIEELVLETFAQSQIARMDYDSVKGKNDHDLLIKRFEQKGVDILIGTQMVVKGLDFENVQLVGILDADGILNFTDFRVNERAFQLMEQVSGRSGRRDSKGLVIVQTSKTNHPVLEFVQMHDYKAFYDFEINNRRYYEYPPYTRLIQIVCKHKEKSRAEEAANIMANWLRKQQQGTQVIGPAEPMIARIRNQYIMEILIKLPKNAQQINYCKKLIAQQIIMLQSNKRYRSVIILPNVDPI